MNADYGDEHRYGFNGKENDRDLQSDDGSNLVLDYGFRIYNPAIARFLSTDPLTKSYPWYTPYQFAGNKPTKFIDLDGKEEAILPNYYGRGGVLVKWSDDKYTYSVPYTNHQTAHYISEDGEDFTLLNLYAGADGEFFGRTPLYMFNREGELNPQFSSDIDKLAFFLGYFTTASDFLEIGPLARIAGRTGKAVQRFLRSRGLNRLEIKKLVRELDADGGHSYSKHGSQTTPKQHKTRLETGEAPDGSVSRNPSPFSSRFASDQIHLEAASEALDELARTNKIKKNGMPKKLVKVHFEFKAAGETFYLNVNGELRTSTSNYVEGYFRYNEDKGTYILETLFPTTKPNPLKS